MPTTVGQHSVATFTSPVNGTTPIDANTVRGNDNTIRTSYVAHDADPGIHLQSSTLASRPAAGTEGRKWVTADAGEYKLWYDDGTRWNEVGNDAVDVSFIADGNIVKGDVLKLTGWNNGQNLPTLAPATVAGDVCFAIATETVSNGGRSFAVNTGFLEDVDTSAFSTGDILYPSNGAGPGSITSWFQKTKPTSGNYQVAAYVIRANASNGVVFVEFSAPRIVERSDNTASTIVLRDASGNFAAGTITAGAVTASGAVSAGSVTSTGLVTFASLKGTGATTVTNILDEDTMSSDSATALATQQSIKAYVDAQVATVDTLAEVLANGNTTGANDIIVSSGQKITTNTIDETTAGSGVTIDSVLLKDNAVTATTFNGTLNGAAPAGSLSGTTLASNVVSSSLTSVGTLANLTVTNPITGSVTGSSGSTTGNAATATALQTARNINGVSFNGTADITVTAAAGTLSGNTLASGVTASSLTSVGTLSSLAVSGDLTVDTSTLKVDSANNRVGIGTATPGYALDVVGGSATALRISGNSASTNNTAMRFYGVNAAADLWAIGNAVSTNDATRNFDIYDLVAGANRLRIDASGNLGLGVTPSNFSGVTFASPILDVSGSINVRGLVANGVAALQLGGDTYRKAVVFTPIGTDTPYLAFGVGSSGSSSGATERARIDASGNLGLGVTPSAWGSSFKALQVGKAVISTNSDTTAYVGSNWVAESGGDKYIAAGGASIYAQSNGAHIWYNAGTGAAGGSISFTERARITAGGYFKASNNGTYVDAAGVGHELVSTADAPAAWVYANRTSGNNEVFRVQLGYAANNTSAWFLYCSDGTAERASIRSNGGLANYQANNVDLSDARTKTDIKPLDSTWHKIAALEIVSYKYIDQTHDDVNIGVIAQQVETVDPVWVDNDGFGSPSKPDASEAVATDADAEADTDAEASDGEADVTAERVTAAPAPEAVTYDPPLKTVYNKDIYFAAIKALQEAMARIETLEARLAAAGIK